jgi:hypothetical protein
VGTHQASRPSTDHQDIDFRFQRNNHHRSQNQDGAEDLDAAINGEGFINYAREHHEKHNNNGYEADVPGW